MANRFDLEQEMLACWNVTDDIKLINERILEKGPFTVDELSNILGGLQTIYNLKFEKLFSTFEELLKEKKI